MVASNHLSLLALLVFTALGAIPKLGERQEGIDCSDLCPTVKDLLSRVQAIEDLAAAKAKAADTDLCLDYCEVEKKTCTFKCESVSGFCL